MGATAAGSGCQRLAAATAKGQEQVRWLAPPWRCCRTCSAFSSCLRLLWRSSSLSPSCGSRLGHSCAAARLSSASRESTGGRVAAIAPACAP